MKDITIILIVLMLGAMIISQSVKLDRLEKTLITCWELMQFQQTIIDEHIIKPKEYEEMVARYEEMFKEASWYPMTKKDFSEVKK